MASGIVNLVFRSTMDSSGFSALHAHAKDAMAQMTDLSRAAQALGPAFGTAGGLAGKFVSSVLKGGVWEIGANGARLLLTQLDILGDKTEETRKEHENLGKAVKDAAAAAAEASRAQMAALDAQAAKTKELAAHERSLAQLRARERQAWLRSVAAEQIARDPAAADAVNARLSERLASAAADDRVEDARRAEKDALDALNQIQSAIAAQERRRTAARTRMNLAYMNTVASEGAFTADASREASEIGEAEKALESLGKKAAAQRRVLDLARESLRVAEFEAAALRETQSAAAAVAKEKERQAEAEKAAKARAETEKALAEYEKTIERDAAQAAAKLAQEEKRRHEERVKALRDEIAAQKEIAAAAAKRLDAETQRLRKLAGEWAATRARMQAVTDVPLEQSTFRDWRRRNTAAGRAEAAGRRRVRNARSADDMRAMRIEAQLRRNGGALLSPADREWIRQYREFMRFQRTNPFEKAADAAAKKAADAAEKAAGELVAMNKRLSQLMEIR